MGQLLQAYKLDGIDKGDRSRLMKMMDHRAEIEAWHRALPVSQRLKLNHPSTILRKWTKATEPPKAPTERKPTTLEKTEAALLEAHRSTLPEAFGTRRMCWSGGAYGCAAGQGSTSALLLVS
jgi:hypothetical protein